MKKTMLLKIMVMSILMAGCGTPRTFIRTTEPSWNTIPLRADVSYDQAWTSIVDLLASRFDIEILSKDDSYLRTGWLYSWSGESNQNYKVRVVIKFSPDKKNAEMRSEAQLNRGGLRLWGRGWITGTDEKLSMTMRTDIMGKVGRVTR